MGFFRAGRAAQAAATPPPRPAAHTAGPSETAAGPGDAAQVELQRQAHAEILELEPADPFSDWVQYGGAELEPFCAFTSLVCIRYLLRLARERRTIEAWQRLPAEAFVSLAQLRRAPGSFSDVGGLPLLALSYPWWSATHPDPQGQQLQLLLPLLEAIVKALDELGDNSTWGVLWDFASLPQRGYTNPESSSMAHDAAEDRSALQLARFRLGLRNINVWYTHKRVWTLLLNTPTPEGASNQQPYDGRGWCIFEQSISSLVKGANNLISMRRYDCNSMNDWCDITEQCKEGRLPPLGPEAFATRLRRGVEDGTVKFTSGSDLEKVVLPNYARGFKAAFNAAHSLNYGKLGWTDMEAEVLAATLSEMARNGVGSWVQELWLDGNSLIGDSGCLFLVNALADGALSKLQKLSFYGCSVGGPGCAALARLLNQGSLPALKAVWVSWHDKREGSREVHSGGVLVNIGFERCEGVSDLKRAASIRGIGLYVRPRQDDD